MSKFVHDWYDLLRFYHCNGQLDAVQQLLVFMQTATDTAALAPPNTTPNNDALGTVHFNAPITVTGGFQAGNISNSPLSVGSPSKHSNPTLFLIISLLTSPTLLRLNQPQHSTALS